MSAFTTLFLTRSGSIATESGLWQSGQLYAMHLNRLPPEDTPGRDSILVSRMFLLQCGQIVTSVLRVGEGGSHDHAYIEVPLTKGKVARVSPEDAELVSGYSWHAMQNQAGNWYARAVAKTAGRRQQVWMHRLILGLDDPSQVADHIDCDGLNNTRPNLRACTTQQNASRRASYRKNARGRGAIQQGNRWVARITVAGKRRYLGMFATEEEASAAYHRAAAELLGDFAPTQPVGSTSY